MKTQNNHPPRTAVPAFLALPIEIRYEIYNLALTTPLLRLLETRAREREAADMSSHAREAEVKPKPLASLIECFTHLLRVCHQIYDEAFPFFYHHVTLSIANPLAFANGFLLRLGSTQISQLKRIEFDICPLGPVQSSAVEGLNSRKFNHILIVFECYPELRNLDMVKMTVVGGKNRTGVFGSDAPFPFRTVGEVTQEQVLSSTGVDGIWNSKDTKALSRTALKLVNGSLKGFRIFGESVHACTAKPLGLKGRIYSITLRKVRHTA